MCNRTKTNQYFLKSDDGTDVAVCKVFFLTTLGFMQTNDFVVRQALMSMDAGYAVGPKPDCRGKAPKRSKVDRLVIRLHIDSFHPTISHYRREHAPNRRYLPSDISRTTHTNLHLLGPQHLMS